MSRSLHTMIRTRGLNKSTAFCCGLFSLNGRRRRGVPAGKHGRIYSCDDSSGSKTELIQRS
jgi:hypothetical protein